MERILLFSDVHANRLALDTVLERVRGQGFNRVWFLGDAVGYGPHPEETINALESLMELPEGNSRHVWLTGNHDWAMLGLGVGDRFVIPSLAVGEIPGEFSSFALRVVEQHRDLLRIWASGFMDRLAAMPVACAQPLHGVYLAHGCFTDSPNLATQIKMLWTYPTSPGVIERQVIAPQYTSWVSPGEHGPILTCSGHWHQRGLWRRQIDAPPQLDGRFTAWEVLPWSETWVALEPGYIYHLNPGSVGFPADVDGCPSYALVEWEGVPQRLLRQRITSAEYNVERVRQELKNLGYPEIIYQKKLLKCT